MRSLIKVFSKFWNKTSLSLTNENGRKQQKVNKINFVLQEQFNKKEPKYVVIHFHLEKWIHYRTSDILNAIQKAHSLSFFISLIITLGCKSCFKLDLTVAPAFGRLLC